MVTKAHAFLEGDRVNATGVSDTGLACCLVYEGSGDLVAAVRCYGTLARLVPTTEATS